MGKKQKIIPLDFFCSCGQKIAPAIKGNKLDWAHPNIVGLALIIEQEALAVVGRCPSCGRPTKAIIGLDELWIIILEAQRQGGGNGKGN